MSNVKFSIFPNQSFIDLSLYQFGRESCTPGHSFGPARRNHFLFHYILSGQGKLLSSDSSGMTHSFVLHEGQGFLIYPDQVNTYIADARFPWEYIWLEFDGLRVKQALEEAGFSFNQPVYSPREQKCSGIVRDEMIYIVDHYDLSTFHLIGHLYLFLDALTQSDSQSDRSSSKLRDFYIREAITYIETNYQNDISIEALAGAIGLNRSYFGKIFKAATGKTPQQFLMNYRMIKAAELLTLTQQPIGDIGIEVGYPNQMHFSRAFRTIYGMSPRDWRIRHS